MTIRTMRAVITNINSNVFTDEDKEEAIETMVNAHYENLPNKYAIWQALKWYWQR